MHSSPSSPDQDVDTNTMKHRIRTADGGTKELDHYARRLAIRSHCTECMGWESPPRDCTSLHCALYPFRGKTLKTRKGERLVMKTVLGPGMKGRGPTVASKSLIRRAS